MNKIIRTVILIIIYVGVLLTYKTVIAEDNISCEVATQDIKVFAKCEVVNKWNIDQWSAFDYIIQKESNWKYTADNPTSSAYGLPQALTALHDLPEDYMTNPQSQILWAIEYIDGRYGTPQEAKDYWIKNKHY